MISKVKDKTAAMVSRVVVLLAALIVLVWILQSDSINKWWAILPALMLASAVFHFGMMFASMRKK